jgi:DNA polymerase
MDKAKELLKVKKDMEQDKSLPLISKPEDVIPGHGNPNAKIVFIGEAGGYHESVQRKPFVGNAGMLLNRLLSSIKIKREDVYITNMVKTRPPDNRDPQPEELEAYGKYLDRELEIIQPSMIVTLGRFSMAKFLPGVTISRVHGKPHEIVWQGRDLTVVPMYHPAAALRNGEVLRQTQADFQGLPEILSKIPKPATIKGEQMGLL